MAFSYVYMVYFDHIHSPLALTPSVFPLVSFFSTSGPSTSILFCGVVWGDDPVSLIRVAYRSVSEGLLPDTLLMTVTSLTVLFNSTCAPGSISLVNTGAVVAWGISQHHPDIKAVGG